MCGRFSNALELDEYRQAVQEQLPNGCQPDLSPDADQYNRSFNVAPQTRALVLRAVHDEAGDGQGRKSDGEAAARPSTRLVLQSMKWGLIPCSTKAPPKGPDAYKTINARDDIILSGSSLWSPLFRRASHRCVVYVQGFYEWLKRGPESKPERIAHFVGMNDPGKGRRGKEGESGDGEHEREYRLMPLAGLWERVRFEGEDEDLYTFTIITTESNSQLSFLHDRMPVILPDAESIALWLGLPWQPSGDVVKKEDARQHEGTPLPEVAKLLKPFDRGQLQCYRVPPEVGKVGNSDPKFILPISSRKDGIMAAFGRAKAKAKVDPSGGGSSPPASSVNTSSQAVSRVKVEEDVAVSQDTNSETNAPLPATSPTHPSSTKRKAEDDDDQLHKPHTAKTATPKRAKLESDHEPGAQTHKSPSANPARRSKTSTSTKAAGSRDIRSFFS